MKEEDVIRNLKNQYESLKKCFDNYKVDINKVQIEIEENRIWTHCRSSKLTAAEGYKLGQDLNHTWIVKAELQGRFMVESGDPIEKNPINFVDLDPKAQTQVSETTLIDFASKAQMPVQEAVPGNISKVCSATASEIKTPALLRSPSVHKVR